MTETLIAIPRLDGDESDPDDPEMQKHKCVHTTSDAARFGVQGALVGGVTLYGWCTSTILDPSVSSVASSRKSTAPSP